MPPQKNCMALSLSGSTLYKSMTHKYSCTVTRRPVSICQLLVPPLQAIPPLNSSYSAVSHSAQTADDGHVLSALWHCTGAEVMSLVNDDENKTFGAVFRTPVDNSKGIPHILEHSVLCGSKKYPIKEPFVELMKGSLNTFLNAFTYPDRTCYPVASTNLQVALTAVLL